MKKILEFWPFLAMVLIVSLPIFPFQDLPMHLTYAHLLANWDSASAIYVKAEEYNVYFNLHYTLAFLSHIVGNVENAFRLCMVIYLLVFYFSLRDLEKNFKKIDIEIEWQLYFPLLALNGTMLLGFVSYAWGIPVVVLALGRFVLWREKNFAWRDKSCYTLIVLLLVLGLMHPVLPWSMLAASIVYQWPSLKELRQWLIFILPLIGLWILGVPGKENFLEIPDGFLDSGYGFEFIDSLFRANWSGVPTKLNYWFWQWIAPLRIRLLLLSCLIVFTGIFYGIYLARRQKMLPPALLLRSFWLMIFGLMLPWGIYWPSEITFINFRMISTWGIVPLLLIGSYLLRTQKGKIIWRILGLYQSGITILALWLAWSEYSSPMSLINSIPPGKRLMPLIYNDKSDYMGKIFRTTHFAAMYYVVRKEGRSHQFWGRYTSHLPVDWQDRERLPGPPDWRPWEFQDKHLQKADYVLVAYEKNRSTADKGAQGILDKYALTSECKKHWCLYKITP